MCVYIYIYIYIYSYVLSISLSMGDCVTAMSTTFSVQSVKEATEYQVVYVCRNGIIKSFTSSTTEVTFPAPSLSGDVFTDAVVVMVTAMNDLGIGPASDPVTAAINGTVMFRCKLHSYELFFKCF